MKTMATTDKRSEAEVPASPMWKRVGWLVLIWAGSVLALGGVSYLLRLFMKAAGMSS
ncbi:cyanide insensitive terminal oxidase, subunit III [Pseudomonas sp. TTU2014-080ASC]|nr:cyanide insensitive terminal oxidase, subunit III [Pseudomonas sp. TTU2014-080ASC]